MSAPLYFPPMRSRIRPGGSGLAAARLRDAEDLARLS